ncbi:MAG: IS1595 family transposase [Fibromonadales bacterium]|nr:IS1595 family transposase [Fibromonadales bacterium]
MKQYCPNVTMSEYDFFGKFPNERSARSYLEQKRWAGGIYCPRCKSSKIGRFGKDPAWHRCCKCSKAFNVKTGTIFERSKIPLHKWFRAFYKIVTARKGVSSMQISKELGVMQSTAWFMIQRIRKAMGNCNNDYIFSGIVECDETYIGGKKRNKHWDKKYIPGRGPVGKKPVFGIVERNGRQKTFVVDYTNRETLQGIIRKHVQKGATICTDEWKSYIGLNKDYTHLTVNHSQYQFKDGEASTNTIEGVWAILKRGYHGSFHCVSFKHLQRYLHEFDFRHNEGNCKYPTMERIEGLVSGCWGTRLTWRELIKNK